MRKFSFLLLATLILPLTLPLSARATNADGEDVPAAEDSAARQTLGMIEDQLRAEHGSSRDLVRRDAHAKAHGCVKSRFDVVRDLPAELRVGVFQPGASYPAWIRYSNGSGRSQNDRVGDGRGMAIKLMGVPGDKILSEERAAKTQDFLMINHPVFFVRNAADYIEFQQAVIGGNPFAFFFPGLNPLRWRAHEGAISAALLAKTVVNPLDSRYWSMVPIKLGDRQAKFQVRPCDGAQLEIGALSISPDFLRENLQRRLSRGDACFDFYLQPRTDARTMPIEDPTIEWSERSAPPVRVARITIPKQDFTSATQMETCENLSMNPWHALPEHRPLGGINRVRRVVYEGISKFRHDQNRAPRVEPESF
jgi:hypothetical protein